eukprot:TRINITY_DN27973_c0_g1_i1.p3 TRINITY_DN27973_c0_g1~~TRINITY_DN27973_c0_g1_i1.p3  ORF type:complete len:110 (+),score=1.52 TRINITY_DN27973_c0_g1_i1:511-840(+)
MYCAGPRCCAACGFGHWRDRARLAPPPRPVRANMTRPTANTSSPPGHCQQHLVREARSRKSNSVADDEEYRLNVMMMLATRRQAAASSVRTAAAVKCKPRALMSSAAPK